jgi:hypothetical protein
MTENEEVEAGWRSEIERMGVACMMPLDGGLVQKLNFPGMKAELDYVSWVAVSAELNKVFGPFGWTDEIVAQETVGCEKYIARSGKEMYRASASVTVRLKIISQGVQLTQHDGLAAFVAENPIKFTAISTALKSSQSRALCRAASKLGWRFGAGLWLKGDDARFHGLVTNDEPVLGRHLSNQPRRREYDFGVVQAERAAPKFSAPEPADLVTAPPLPESPKKRTTWLPESIGADLREAIEDLPADSPLDEGLTRRLFRSLAWESIDPGIIPDKEYSAHVAGEAFDRAGIEEKSDNFLAAGKARDWFRAACLVRADKAIGKDKAKNEGAFDNRASFPTLNDGDAHRFDEFESAKERPGAFRFMIYRARTKKELGRWRTTLNLVIPDKKVIIGFDMMHGTEPQRRRAFGFLGCLEIEGWRHWDLLDHPEKFLGQWGAGHFVGVGGRTILDKFISRAAQKKIKEAAQAADVPDAEQLVEAALD